MLVLHPDIGSDFEVEIGGDAAETRGVISGEFKGEIEWWRSLIRRWHEVLDLVQGSEDETLVWIGGEEDRMRE
ncbi:hypothetical protein SO802_034593 [Lithocarpus litseifolius]|uniref:Uncharacterized protein n=1 Tax=Lithocarpus litseifolius TaxID=425828 RepID=A0AAW2BI45_9ROSI